MTLREKIADWLTRGNYSKSVRLVEEATDMALARHNMAVLRGEALRKIIQMQTPSASATVRRMARTAREALR